MILQPGLIGNWHKDKATLQSMFRHTSATVAARAKLGIPPTLYLPTTDLAAKCEAVKEIDRQSGCGFAIHINFGSKWWAGNDAKTGAMKSPLGNDAAWMEETSQLHVMLFNIGTIMWAPNWMPVAEGVQRVSPLLRAIILEDEWRVKADEPKNLFTTNATPDMLAAIARRWSQRIASLSILGPSHDLICYGRGYNEAWTFEEEAAGNRLDVGRNVYRVAEYRMQKPPCDVGRVDLAGYLNDQCSILHRQSRGGRVAMQYPPTTAWLTLGLGYDAAGKWHDDGPELYKPFVSGQVGRLLTGKVDNVVVYRHANEAHLRAFMRGYAGPVTSRVKGSTRKDEGRHV